MKIFNLKILFGFLFLIAAGVFYYQSVSTGNIEVHLTNSSSIPIIMEFVCNKTEFSQHALKPGVEQNALRLAPPCEGELGVNLTMNNNKSYFKLLGYVPVTRNRVIQLVIKNNYDVVVKNLNE